MSESTISDEMVEAFLALQTARIDGTERVRAGLAAVVPLIRAQIAAEHESTPRSVEPVPRGDGSGADDSLTEWDVTVTMVRTIDGRKDTRDFTMRVPAADRDGAETAANGIGYGINEGSRHAWKFASDDAISVRRTPDRPTIPADGRVKVGWYHAIADAGTAEADRLWAEIENGPPMPAGWCTWHQMAACAGDAPECREARAEIAGGGDRG